MSKIETPVSDTLTEKGIWIKFGLIPLYIKPLNFSQVTEIAELISKYNNKDYGNSDGKTFMSIALDNIAKEGNAEIIHKICKISVFRSAWKRKVFGFIVSRNLTSEVYKKIFSCVISAYDLSFFLTSLVFMKGVKMKTKSLHTEEE